MNTNAKVFSLGLDMLRSWALLLCFVTIPAFSQTVIGPGKVSGTWTAQNSPYIIQGFFSVEENQTLVIKPGTVVKFDSYSLRVVYSGRKLPRIPVKTATDSGRKLPPVPAETCHPIPALL